MSIRDSINYEGLARHCAWIQAVREWAQKRKSQHPQIAIGSLWVLHNYRDPFPTRDRPPVRVLDVKDGWVRYYIGEAFPDERMSVELFLGIFRQAQASDTDKSA